MAEEFTKEAVLKYILDNGGKVTNHELVKHFKRFLSGNESQVEARTLFKEYVNAIASIKQEDGVKYVILKKRTHDLKGTNGVQDVPGSAKEPEAETKKCKLSEDVNSNSTASHSTIVHSHSSPSLTNSSSDKNGSRSSLTHSFAPPVLWSSDLPPGHVPQPPPRRKHSTKGKENRSSKYEETVRQMKEEKTSESSPITEEFKEILSPGSVKEKAQIINKMASELDIVPRGPHFPSASISGRRRDTRLEKGIDDDDASSVSTLDPRRKEWIMKACRADYHGLLRLLREEPKLASVKDFNSYTALHWAAKHGNLDIIKLLAGTQKVNPNAKTSGGCTPLHLAAMFGREEIMEVLINTYGADPTVRDYSGKRAIYYLPKEQAERFVTLFPALSFPITLCGKLVSGQPKKDSGLTRMGSLNSKVKKTSVLSAGGKALTRMKSWGSADNIQDRDRMAMPPPKFFPKRKKSRKHTEYITGTSESFKGATADSDSDSTSGTAV